MADNLGVTGPDWLERVLGWGALAILAGLVAAVVRGAGHWGEAPWIVWAHMATIAPALALTPVMLWRRRGDARHRLMGWIWVSLMAVTAVMTLGIRQVNHGGFSYIHLLTLVTLVSLVTIVRSARGHNVVRHRRTVRGLVIGAMLLAGFFTFPFGRMLGMWLLG
ncbi:MAG: hypothetical protein RLY97_53 [Pseudomonadota bacterium]